MKHMGWSYDELMDAPAELVDEIEFILSTDAKNMKELEARAKERDSQAGKSSPKSAVVERDERTGFEIQKTVKKDGTVVRHRKLEDGEKILHTIFGPPPSWRGKR